jgi:hypothetical protein
MDQRREPRFATNQSVVVTVLGEHARRETAVVKNASARGLAIEVPGPIAPGTALKIEFEDSTVLGEAVYCGGGPDSHLVGVELDQVICSLTQLGRKLQEFADGRNVRTASGARLEKQNTPIP